MIPVMQTRRGGPNDPPEERGNCFDACLASILELSLDDVPVVHGDDWWNAAQAAVARHGHTIVTVYDLEVAAEEIGAADIGAWLGDVYWIAAVPSRNLGTYDDGRPVQHVIVMRGGEVAHDPAAMIGKARAIGPLPDGDTLFEALVLLPLAERAAA